MGRRQDMRATRPVLIRDFLIFQLKLVLDGFKDLFLFWGAIVAVILDLFFSGKRKRIFYSVMALGERIDLWLNLHGAIKKGAETGDGLFGGSKAGSDNLLGKLEQAVRGGDVPRRSRRSRDLNGL
jgi:hypothetical protein